MLDSNKGNGWTAVDWVKLAGVAVLAGAGLRMARAGASFTRRAARTALLMGEGGRGKVAAMIGEGVSSQTALEALYGSEGALHLPTLAARRAARVGELRRRGTGYFAARRQAAEEFSILNQAEMGALYENMSRAYNAGTWVSGKGSDAWNMFKGWTGSATPESPWAQRTMKTARKWASGKGFIAGALREYGAAESGAGWTRTAAAYLTRTKFRRSAINIGGAYIGGSILWGISPFSD
jgi:hypothetical protein